MLKIPNLGLTQETITATSNGAAMLIHFRWSVKTACGVDDFKREKDKFQRENDLIKITT